MSKEQLKDKYLLSSFRNASNGQVYVMEAEVDILLAEMEREVLKDLVVFAANNGVTRISNGMRDLGYYYITELTALVESYLNQKGANEK